LSNNQAPNYLNQKRGIQLQEKETRPLFDPHLNKFKKIQKTPTATTLCKFCDGRGYCCTMRWPRQGNDGGHIAILRLSAAIIFTLLSRFVIPPNVHCNDHYSNMAVTKQSDAAAAAAITSKPTAKVSKPKE
jgi:hypothetical protein